MACIGTVGSAARTTGEISALSPTARASSSPCQGKPSSRLSRLGECLFALARQVGRLRDVAASAAGRSDTCRLRRRSRADRAASRPAATTAPPARRGPGGTASNPARARISSATSSGGLQCVHAFCRPSNFSKRAACSMKLRIKMVLIWRQADRLDRPVAGAARLEDDRAHQQRVAPEQRQARCRPRHARRLRPWR